MAAVQHEPLNTNRAGKNHRQKNDPGTIFHFWLQRDSQRTKLYYAEHDMHYTGESARDLPRDLQLAADIVFSQLEERLPTYLMVNYFRPDIIREPRLSRGAADYHPRAGIRLGAEAKLWAMVHEFAHHVTECAVQGKHACHGVEFRRTLLLCAEALWGSGYETDQLRSGYRKYNLKY